MKTLDELRRWAASAPDGTMVPAACLAELLDAVEATETAPMRSGAGHDEPTTWRALLWTVDAETRIGRDELLEAVGRGPSWLYRHTGPSADDRMPHRKLDGQLVFVVGEVRRWLRDHEELIEVGQLDGAPRLRSIEGGR